MNICKLIVYKKICYDTTYIHDILILWINFIVTILPPRVMATYIELLIGAIISGSGYMFDALFEVGHQKNIQHTI